MGKTYVTSDWHGCSNPALKIFDYLKEDDTLYFLGDAIDRGPDGIKLMNKLLIDSRVIYLKGNHEEFIEQYVPELIEGHSSMADLWLYQNGGQYTWDAMQHMSDDSKMFYVYKIHKMSTKAVYHSPLGHHVILEHAGYTPFDMPHRTHYPLWDREHFYDEWDGGFYAKEDGLKPNNTYLVHGHTPVQYLMFEYGYKGQKPKDKDMMKIGQMWDSPEIEWKPEVLKYCDGHKFDIDMCTIVSGRVALLDLDTFETIYFDENKEED